MPWRFELLSGGKQSADARTAHTHRVRGVGQHRQNAERQQRRIGYQRGCADRVSNESRPMPAASTSSNVVMDTPAIMTVSPDFPTDMTAGAKRNGLAPENIGFCSERG